LIAERRFLAYRADGTSVAIRVRLGTPFLDPSLPGDWRCPVEVTGPGEPRTMAPWGEDPFVALQYAIDVAGDLLDSMMAREKLEVRRAGEVHRSSWIWRYPPDDGGAATDE
jgi:hypothetical protein